MKADEMFESLGYKLDVKNDRLIKYARGLDNIIFYKNVEGVYSNTTLLRKQLQAINQKVKELGWNENI